MRPILITCLLVAGCSTHAQPLPEPVARITFSPISESSGMVQSRRFDNVFWVHNDSGDAPRLFAINGEGKVIYPGFMAVHGETPEQGKTEYQGVAINPAYNYDWEDVAIDDNYIYIADIGNNGNARRDLGIYVVAEPNPRAVAATRPITWYPVRYPEQSQYPADEWHYDAESLFVFNDKFYIITKHREDRKISQLEAGAQLYRMDTRHTDRPNVLTRVAESREIAAATAAELAPDGRQLAVLCHLQLWVFETPANGDNFFASPARKISMTLEHIGQAESVTWLDNETLLIGNEQGGLYTMKVAEMPPHPR